MPRFHTYRRMAKEFVLLMATQYREKACQKSAASLTYVTLFAIVPLMTVTYSMFSIIPAFKGLGEQLQQLVFAHVLPETGQELVAYLQEFSEQARNLTFFGVLFLVISAYVMLTNIEKNFNSIWGVLRGRKGVANFLLYWAVLSLGPLLLGAGLAMTTYLASLRLLMDAYDNLGLVAWVLEIAPLILTAAAFTLLFIAVPNCKVPFTHGLIGGVVTMVAFEILKGLFGWIVTHTSFTLIYGAFAIVPLFLLWVNLIWMVILGGAVLVRTISIYQIALKDRGYPDLLAALLVLWEFHQASLKGHSLADRRLISIGLSSGQWQRICARLQKAQVISATNQGEFVLCQDLHHLTLAQLAKILSQPHQLPEDTSKLNDLPWFDALQYHLGEIDNFTNARLAVSVVELFQNRLPPAAEPAQVVSNPN
jgi:membrane protein